MSTNSNAVAVAAKFANVSDYNEFLRRASTDELVETAAVLEAEISSLGGIRSSLMELLQSRLNPVRQLLKLC